MSRSNCGITVQVIMCQGQTVALRPSNYVSRSKYVCVKVKLASQSTLCIRSKSKLGCWYSSPFVCDTRGGTKGKWEEFGVVGVVRFMSLSTTSAQLDEHLAISLKKITGKGSSIRNTRVHTQYKQASILHNKRRCNGLD